jgi:phage regulator Rha-like protein
VVVNDGTPVVSHRVIADSIGYEHKAILDLITRIKRTASYAFNDIPQKYANS